MMSCRLYCAVASTMAAAVMALCDQLEASLTTTCSCLLESLPHEALGSQTEADA